MVPWLFLFPMAPRYCTTQQATQEALVKKDEIRAIEGDAPAPNIVLKTCYSQGRALTSKASHGLSTFTNPTT